MVNNLASNIKSLFKSYHEQLVLNDLSLEIAKGSLIHISGSSGSGKTTLLRCIAGLEKVDDGEIYLFDEKVQSKNFATPSVKRKIGMVFQDLILFPHLTVFQNVDFVSKAIIRNKNERKHWNFQILQKMRIDHKAEKYPHEISGGEQQRVAIARAIAHSPNILLLDEPFTHLDEDLRDNIFTDLMSLLKQQNISSIFVSHDNASLFQDKFIRFKMIEGKLINLIPVQ